MTVILAINLGSLTLRPLLFFRVSGGDPGTNVISLDSKGLMVTVNVGISKLGTPCVTAFCKKIPKIEEVSFSVSLSTFSRLGEQIKRLHSEQTT